MNFHCNTMLFDYCNDRQKELATCTDLQRLSINKNLQVAGSLHDDTRASIAIRTVHAAAMADKVARALNLLGADRDLLDSADANSLLDLIDEYLDDSEGIAPPVTQPFNYTTWP